MVEYIMPYTIAEAAEALRISPVTVRRYIKAGRLSARLERTDRGPTYIIDDITPLMTSHAQRADKGTAQTTLITRIEELSQELGFYKARVLALEERNLELQDKVKLLEAPSVTRRQSIWSRIFHR